MLKTLRTVASKYDRELVAPPKLRYLMAEHARYQIDLIRGAWFDATSIDNGEQRLTEWMTAADAKSMADVFRHFEPRFQTWWQSTAHAECDRYAIDLEAQLKDPWVKGTMQKVLHFTKTEHLNTIFRMHAILKPGNSGSTAATQIDAHLPFEFEAGESARTRADVLMHEMTHYYFASVPNDALARLVSSVETRFGNDAPTAFGLLNEGIATTVGNGLGGQHFNPERYPACLSTPRCLYNDDAIHTTAAELTQSSSSWFGATLDSPEFLDAYESAIAKATQTPDAHLLPLRTTFAVSTTSQFTTPLAWFRSRARMGSISAFGSVSDALKTMLADYPLVSLLVLARPIDLPSMTILPEAARGTKTSCQMRVGDRNVWILVASSESEMQAEVVTSASVPPAVCGKIAD